MQRIKKINELHLSQYRHQLHDTLTLAECQAMCFCFARHSMSVCVSVCAERLVGVRRHISLETQSAARAVVESISRTPRTQENQLSRANTAYAYEIILYKCTRGLSDKRSLSGPQELNHWSSAQSPCGYPDVLQRRKHCLEVGSPPF